MVRVGGLHYTIDPSRPLLERIVSAKLDSGEEIDPAKTYQVAGWAVVGDHPDGPLIWDVVREYLLEAKDDNDVIKISKIYHPEIVGVKDNPGITDYEGALS